MAHRKRLLSNTPTKTIKLEEILDAADIKKAEKLYAKCQKEKRMFAKNCADFLITPKLKEINARLGQKNDATYLAYCVEYCLLHADGNARVN